MAELRGLLVDMDGTLLDSEKVWDVALNDLASWLGGTLSAPARASMLGSNMYRSIGILHDDLGVDADPARSADQLTARTAELFAEDKYQEYMLVHGIGVEMAEALAELWHRRIREELGIADEDGPDLHGLFRQQYRGGRYSWGYPACPEHTEKQTLWELLDVQQRTGIELTESMAMWPGAAVSGWYFSHPQAQYFVVGRLGRDQVADYAERKGWTLTQAEKWLSPSLGYDPDD